MLLSGALITGTSLVVGVRAYQENKKKREKPWTVYAEKRGIIPKKKASRPFVKALLPQFGPLSAAKGKTSFERAKARKDGLFGAEHIALGTDSSEISAVSEEVNHDHHDFAYSPFAGFQQIGTQVEQLNATMIEGLRLAMSNLPFFNDSRQQQLATLGATLGEPSEAEKEAIERLKLASLAVGLAVGGLYFFPLSIASVLCFAGPMSYYYKAAWTALFKERRVEGNVSYAVYFTLALLGGKFVPLVLGVWFFTLTSWLVIKTEDHSKQSIINLFGKQIRSVWLLMDDTEVEVPIDEVQAGDLIVVHAGQMVPMDGIIVEGMASIDQQMLTGEAQPVEKGAGERALAATIVRSGRICLRVENTGQFTVAAQIGEILTNTSDFKESVQSQAEVFSDQVAWPFLALSGLALPVIGLDRALGVLLGTPGYRMVLYGPLSMLSYLHVAVERRILIKDGRSLELLPDVDTVVFDKTGTLTIEQPHVSRIIATQGYRENEVLAYAAAAEVKQSHPIARAILQAAHSQDLTLATIDDAHYEIGYGIQVTVDGQKIYVGSQRFMQMQNISIPAEIATHQEESHAEGNSFVFVAVDDKLAGAIELQPTIRPEAEAVVRGLRGRGLRLVIISGDHEAPTRRLAHELGMDGYFAEVLPEDKAELVKQLQAEGRHVCFVGDGINDSIALKTANVSVSLRGATTIATDTAQIVLMDEHLGQLAHVFELADEFAANMHANFLVATIPNLFMVGGALFLGWGFMTCTLLGQIPLPFALYNTVRPLLGQQNHEHNTIINGGKTKSD